MSRIILLWLIISGSITANPNPPVSHHQISSYFISSDNIEFFRKIEFPLNNKHDEKILKEYSIWIAKKENQTRFLATLTQQLKKDKQILPEEIRALKSLEHALTKWSNILEYEKIF